MVQDVRPCGSLQQSCLTWGILQIRNPFIHYDFYGGEDRCRGAVSVTREVFWFEGRTGATDRGSYHNNNNKVFAAISSTSQWLWCLIWCASIQ